MGARLLPQSNLSEGTDSDGGQLREKEKRKKERKKKECPFSGVSKSGRVWRKAPQSGAGSVGTNKIAEAT